MSKWPVCLSPNLTNRTLGVGMWHCSSSASEHVARPLRLQIVAALAASSLVFAEINPAYSANLLRQAESLYLEITETDNLGRYSDIMMEGCRLATDPISVSTLVISLVINCLARSADTP